MLSAALDLARKQARAENVQARTRNGQPDAPMSEGSDARPAMSLRIRRLALLRAGFRMQRDLPVAKNYGVVEFRRAPSRRRAVPWAR